MTEVELAEEWQYRFTERLGILCGGAIPTIDQAHMAVCDADDAVKRLRANYSEEPLLL